VPNCLDLCHNGAIALTRIGRPVKTAFSRSCFTLYPAILISRLEKLEVVRCVTIFLPSPTVWKPTFAPFAGNLNSLPAPPMKAFQGELVLQDPNDETTTELQMHRCHLHRRSKDEAKEV